jgi:hypothetical protein
MPETRNSVVACLHILGYGERLDRAADGEATYDLLRCLRASIDNAGNWAAELRNEDSPQWMIRAFDDKVVVSFPTSETSSLADEELAPLFLHLAFFQTEMIHAGFFVRGAISVGELFIDSDIVAGKALGEACAAERRLARVPRIVLAPSAEALVARHHRWYGRLRGSAQNRVVLRDSDDRPFLSYLEETMFVAGDGAGPFLLELANHRDSVTEKLNKYRCDPDIWPLYAWAGRYHNFFCDIHGIEPQFRVRGRKLRAGPRLLSSPTMSRPAQGILRDGLTSHTAM